MYLWAISCAAVMKSEQGTRFSNKSIILVLPFRSQEIIENLAMKECLRIFPPLLGYTFHQVSYCQAPEYFTVSTPYGERKEVRLTLDEGEVA